MALNKWFVLGVWFVCRTVVPSAHAGVIYQGSDFRTSQQKALAYGQTFATTGMISVTKKGVDSLGTGALIVIEGHPAVITAAHVVEGASRLKFLLPHDGHTWSIPLESSAIHVYPLYLKLKDKSLDVALVLLDPQIATLQEDRVEVKISWFTTISFPFSTLAPFVYEESFQCLISYAGYGLAGSFNDKGYGRYAEGDPQKRGAQMRMVPQKNVFFQHGCGAGMIDGCEDFTPDALKKIADENFSLYRDHKANAVEDLLKEVNIIGAFSPGDSGAPIFDQGKIIAVVSTAERPLIELAAKDFYGLVDAEKQKVLQDWDQSLGEGSFAQSLLRSWIKWHQNIPDFSVQLFQTAAALTPAVYDWMRGVVVGTRKS